MGTTKFKFKMNLLVEFVLYIVILLALILFFLMSSVLKEQQRVATRQLIERGKTLIEVYGISTVEALKRKDDLFLMDYGKAILKCPDVVYAMVLDIEGKVLAHSDVKEWGKIYRDSKTIKALTATDYLVQRYARRNKRYYDIALPIKTEGYKKTVVCLGLSTLGMEQRMAEAKEKTLVISLVVLLVGILGAAFLANTVAKPLKEMGSVAAALHKGKAEDKVSIERGDEIGQLARILNQAIGQIKERYQTYENELANKESRATLFFKNIGGFFREGIILTDSENKIIHLNDIAREILFSPGERPIGQHMLEAIRNVELLELLEKSMSSLNQILEEELRSIGRGVKISTIADERGEPIGTIIILSTAS